MVLNGIKSTIIKTNRILLFVTFLGVLTTYAVLYIGSVEAMVRHTSEDGLFENLTALASFLAAVVFIYLYLRSVIGNNFYLFRTRKNIFFLLLALLFVFVAGEEISWGQRILGLKTPEAFSQNTQNEINIHNLEILMHQHRNQEGLIEKRKHLFTRIINVDNLMNAFWVSWTLLVPLLYKGSRKVKNLLDKINLPFGPLWVGIIFIINNLLLHVVRYLIPHHNDFDGIRAVEVKERNIALLFLTLSLTILIREKWLKDELVIDKPNYKTTL